MVRNLQCSWWEGGSSASPALLFSAHSSTPHIPLSLVVTPTPGLSNMLRFALQQRLPLLGALYKLKPGLKVPSLTSLYNTSILHYNRDRDCGSGTLISLLGSIVPKWHQAASTASTFFPSPNPVPCRLLFPIIKLRTQFEMQPWLWCLCADTEKILLRICHLNDVGIILGTTDSSANSKQHQLFQ